MPEFFIYGTTAMSWWVHSDRRGGFRQFRRMGEIARLPSYPQKLWITLLFGQKPIVLGASRHRQQGMIRSGDGCWRKSSYPELSVFLQRVAVEWGGKLYRYFAAARGKLDMQQQDDQQHRPPKLEEDDQAVGDNN